MPKNPVTDPITDQEIAFARLVLTGTMNDRQAAEAAGLNPNTAAYTKAKPQVRAWMAKHRAAVNETILTQEAEGIRAINARREQILARLWQLANLDPETTRGSIAGQIKAMSMIVAIEGLIPDSRQTAAAAKAAAPSVAPRSTSPSRCAHSARPSAWSQTKGSLTGKRKPRHRTCPSRRRQPSRSPTLPLTRASTIPTSPP